MVAVRRGSRGGMVDMHVVSNPRFREVDDILKLVPADMRGLTNRIGAAFRRDMRRLFATEGASGGEKWAKLSPAYRKWKKKRFPGRKILTRTGALRKSLTQKTANHVARWYLRPRAVIELGTRNETARHHVTGGPYLPVRDPLQTTATQQSDYLAEVSRLYKGKLRRVARALAAGHAAMQRRRGR